MPASSDRPVRGPDTLVLRAVFVPEGEQPPPEFSTDFQPLRFPATLDPATGEITCDAQGSFDGDVRAEWYADEDQEQFAGGDWTDESVGDEQDQSEDDEPVAWAGSPKDNNPAEQDRSGLSPRSYPGGNGGNVGRDADQDDPTNRTADPGDEGAAAQDITAAGSNSRRRAERMSSTQAASGPTDSLAGDPTTPVAGGTPPMVPVSENVQLASDSPDVATDLPPGNKSVIAVRSSGMPGDGQAQNARARDVMRILDVGSGQPRQSRRDVSARSDHKI